MKSFFIITFWFLLLSCKIENGENKSETKGFRSERILGELNLSGTYIDEEYMDCINKNNIFQKCSSLKKIKGITISDDTLTVYEYSYSELSFLISEDNSLRDENKKNVGNIKSINSSTVKLDLFGEKQTFMKVDTFIYKKPINYYINSKKITGNYIMTNKEQQIHINSLGTIQPTLMYLDEIVYDEFEVEIDFIDFNNSPMEFNIVYLIDRQGQRRMFGLQLNENSLDIFNKQWTGDNKTDGKRNQQDSSVFILKRKVSD